MNIKITNFIVSKAFAMLCLFLTLLIFLLYFLLYTIFNGFLIQLFHLLNITSAYLILWMLWFMAWKTYKKKVLLHIFGILLPIGILSFLLWDKQITSMLLITGKLIVFLLCACAIS